MTKTIDTKKNPLLRPFQLFLEWFVHICFLAASSIAPSKYKSRIIQFESNRTLSNIIGLTMFNALGGILLMITNIKLANMLGAAIYGVYSYYIAIGEVGITFVRYGRDKSMVRDLIQKPNEFNGLVSNTFVLSLLNLLLFLIVILLCSNALDISVGFASISLVLATCLVSLDLQPVYESINFMSWHSLYMIIQRLLNLALIWLPLLFVDILSLDYIGIVLLVSWLVVLIVQYQEIMTQLSVKLNGNVTTKSIVFLYKSNFLIALSCIFGVAFGPFIRLVLKNSVDDTAVGLYSACFQIFLIGKFILTQIARVGNPMMAEAGKQDCSQNTRKKLIRRYLVIMAIGTLPFAIPMIIASGFITDICFNSEYYEIRNYIPYFGIYLFSMAIGNVYEQFLISMRKDKLYFSIYIGCSFLTIIMAFLLIPIYNVLGGVIAFIVPNILARVLYCMVGISLLKS